MAERHRTTNFRRRGSKRQFYAPPSSSSEDEQDDDNMREGPGAGAAHGLGIDQDQNFDDHNLDNRRQPGNAGPNADHDSDADSNWSAELRGGEFLDGDEDEDEEEEEEEDGGYNNIENSEDEQDFIIQNLVEDNVSDSSDSGNEEDNNDPNFKFDSASFNRVLEFAMDRTVRESVLLELALSLRHKSTFECLIDSFFSKNILYGTKFFPTSKKELWKLLGRSEAGIEAYVYCPKCFSYLGKKKNLGDYVVCPVPECPGHRARTAINKASYFVTLSLKKQLQYFFSIPGISEQLAYRETRKKHDEAAIEDMFDGSDYQNIVVDGKNLMNSNNYTMTLNLDGCKASKSGALTIVPVFLRLNELPPTLRQKFMFLAAVYVDRKEPDMTTYLHPVVKQLKRLETQGVTWHKGNEEILSKIIVPNFCVDGKACAQLLNMVTHLSHFGCPCCTYYGVSVNRTMRYPSQHPDLPPYEARTDATMREQMVLAQTQKNQLQRDFIVQGHQGTTPLMDLNFMDLAKGNCSDDLHYVYQCAALQHTELLLKEVPKQNGISEKVLLKTIDLRMQAIKTPSCIARKPGSCSVQNRKQWHGNEWRNWLWYCSMVCLHGLFSLAEVQHLERLSYASFLLSQDIILPDHIDRAEELLREYLRLYDGFGIDKTRRNLHALIHAPDSVRRWGPLWCYSTFNFESWNHCLMQLISSPKGALQQIITRHLISLSINVAIEVDEQVSPDIKNQLKKIMKKPRHIRACEVGNQMYVLGPAAMRPATHQENQALNEQNFNPPQVTAYQKILIRGTTYSTAAYQEQHDSKSDDSSIYTYGNIFCTIQSIVTFESLDGSQVCRLLVRQNSVIRRPNGPLFPYAKHICQVDVQGDQNLLCIKPEDIRSPVVKAPLLDMMFFIPVPNLNEID